MVDTSPENRVRYVTNAAGETTDVLVPLDLWEQVISDRQDPDSGLSWIDEYEPKTQVLSDLVTSLKQAATGQTFPISQLWEDLET